MIVLVLGGARSGKSNVAERLARRPGPVTYVATYVATGPTADPDMAARIVIHRDRRPPDWVTVEATPDQLVEVVRSAPPGVVLLDSLTTWLAAAPEFVVDVEALCAALQGREGDTVIVSDEVGLGVHPSSGYGRRFRDQLGLLNQSVAEVADRVLLVVAGRVLPLERLALDAL
ncbi:MAG: bifunctional adenosylcobinamide kinase/adenosylcobinamide-phosphate guanylyltransferase [Acidimicrobiales bacterium]